MYSARLYRERYRFAAERFKRKSIICLSWFCNLSNVTKIKTFKSDPYIQIEVGKLKVDNRDSYIPNSTNPEFGRLVLKKKAFLLLLKFNFEESS